MTDPRNPFAYAAGEVLLRLTDVTTKTAFGKTSIYDLMEKGQFPRPVRVGGYAVRWKASEIEAWIASLPTA